MKPLNLDASLATLDTKYQLLEFEEDRFHALDSTLLYKEKRNYGKVLVKFMQCLLIHFDAPHSVISDRGTHFQSILKRFFKQTRITHLLIIAYHPHLSSLEEVMNHELELIFGKTIDQSLRNW